MSYNYTTIDDNRVEVNVAAAFYRMDADFFAAFGLHLHVNSGTRTREEQVRGYDDFISGRTKIRWAPPGFSNHEEDGPNGPRSIDIRDDGDDAGVMTRGTRRDRWMEANAGNYGFENEGYNFSEAWHKTFRWAIGGAVSGGGGSGSPAYSQDTVNRQNWLNTAFGAGLDPDGYQGPKTTEAIKAYQRVLGVTDDGDWGPLTQAAHERYYAQWVGAQAGAAPGFPLPAGSYFGPAGGGDNSVSGYYSHRDDLRRWQQRMADRGWTITVDGLYGAEGASTPSGNTYEVAKAFQTEKGLTVDGLIGSETWAAAWNAPITAPTTPTPANPTPSDPSPSQPQPTTPGGDNPRGLKTYTPVYPGANRGLVSPFADGPRGFKGEDHKVVPTIIDRFIIHWTGVLEDQLDWFSYNNSRNVSPSWYLREQVREAVEFIRPGLKPAATGSEWNWRSVAVEVQKVGDGVADWTLEWLAGAIAWLASYDGKTLDGVPVDFQIDRAHVISHREALPGTECPGEFLQSKLNDIVARAKVIYAEKYTAQTPTTPPVIVPPSWSVTVAERDAIAAAYTNAGLAFDALGVALQGLEN